jgi:glycerol uptake facilitator protein
MGMSTPNLAARSFAEVVGTFLLVFFGCGAVHVAVLTGSLSGLLQPALVWGIGVMIAVYVVGGISGAHINPAITVALALWGRCRWSDVIPYVVGQLAGAFLAAASLYFFYSPLLAEKEGQEKVVRGEPGSEITAMCYGEFFPNPGTADAAKAYKQQDSERLSVLVPHETAFALEVLGTLILALVVFAVTDERNVAAPAARLAPAFIGLTVAILIVVMAPLTQACLNPARDFGPRLFTWLAGWGTIAMPGIRSPGFLTVYILAPVVGAVLGGGLYVRILRPALPRGDALDSEPG